MLINNVKLSIITNVTIKDLRSGQLREDVYFFTSKSADMFDETFSSTFIII